MTSKPTSPADLRRSTLRAAASFASDDHGQTVRRPQCHAQRWPYRVAGDRFEAEVFDDRGKHKRRLLQGKGGSDAFARFDAERQVGKSINRRSATTEKAVRIEQAGSIPQQAMPVQDIRRDHDQ